MQYHLIMMRWATCCNIHNNDIIIQVFIKLDDQQLTPKLYLISKGINNIIADNWWGCLQQVALLDFGILMNNLIFFGLKEWKCMLLHSCICCNYIAT